MNRNTPVNVHELLKSQVFSEDITPHSRNNANAGTGNKHNDKYMFFEQNRPYSQQTFGVSDSYLILDSFTKAAASELELGILSWNIQTQGPTNVEQGIIGSMRLLGNVIEIELGAFTLPILKENNYPINTFAEKKLNNSNISLIQNNSSGDTLIPVLPLNQIPPESQAYTEISHAPWLNNPLSQTPFSGQITIQIKEAGAQAYSGGHISGSFHHFIFQIQYDPDRISPNSTNVIPMSEGTNLYIFTEPIIDFNTITLLFRNPDYPIQFEPDIINCDINCNFGNAIAQGGNYFLQFDCRNHNLLTEDRIYLKNIKTGIQNLDDYLNSPAGILVGNSPTANGDSQNNPTGSILSNSDIFYLDPFVAFNQSFLITTDIYNINIIANNTFLELTAIIIFPFGEKRINLELSIDTTTVTNSFNINNIWHGSYTININGTTGTGTATINQLRMYNVLVYVAKRRIRIPIRLRTIVNKVTNYITPI